MGNCLFWVCPEKDGLYKADVERATFINLFMLGF